MSGITPSPSSSESQEAFQVPLKKLPQPEKKEETVQQKLQGHFENIGAPDRKHSPSSFDPTPRSVKGRGHQTKSDIAEEEHATKQKIHNLQRAFRGEPPESLPKPPKS